MISAPAAVKFASCGTGAGERPKNPTIMKATISQLWETGRDLITFDGDEFARPQSFADLKKCENVLLGDKIPGTKMRQVLIDNSIVLVGPMTVRHPAGGTMSILEVQ